VKASLRHVDDHGVRYDALMFMCPGCATPYTLIDGTEHTPSGIHMLPVNSSAKSPQWTWDGNLEAPTLSPSILSHIHPYDDQSRPQGVCHSFLVAGVLQFLGDCTHPLAGQNVPLPDLPGWAEDA
jgi:hypothetical protein